MFPISVGILCQPTVRRPTDVKILHRGYGRLVNHSGNDYSAASNPRWWTVASTVVYDTISVRGTEEYLHHETCLSLP